MIADAWSPTGHEHGNRGAPVRVGHERATGARAMPERRWRRRAQAITVLTRAFDGVPRGGAHPRGQRLRLEACSRPADAFRFEEMPLRHSRRCTVPSSAQAERASRVHWSTGRARPGDGATPIRRTTHGCVTCTVHRVRCASLRAARAQPREPGSWRPKERDRGGSGSTAAGGMPRRGPGSARCASGRSGARPAALPCGSRRCHSRGDDGEAEHPHERLRRVGRSAAAIVLSAVLRHRVRRAPSLSDAPVQDHAPAAGGLLTALEEFREIGQGAADDDEVARRGAEASSSP